MTSIRLIQLIYIVEQKFPPRFIFPGRVRHRLTSYHVFKVRSIAVEVFQIRTGKGGDIQAVTSNVRCMPVVAHVYIP